MKTKIITALKKEILLVEVEDDIIKTKNYVTDYFTLLGKPDEIKEEDVKDLVETKQYGSRPFFCTLDYSYEGNTEFRPGFCADDGKQFRRSFNSALEKEIYWVNPLQIPSSDDINWFRNQRDGDFSERYTRVFNWYDNQEKTFDKKRTLIFVKN